ncbi:MAG TPA: alpha/beta fold hydrolase [Allosphingosinicella sp.]
MLNVGRLLGGETSGLIPIRDAPKAERALVFIHGFRTNSRETWGLARDSYFWPFDIGQSLGAAVYCYEYLNKTFRGTGRASLAHNLVANQLLYEMAQTAHQRFVLITHSFGGIVAKQAFVNALLGEPQDRDIAHRIFGFAAFACPNYGHWLAHINYRGYLWGRLSSPNANLLRPGNKVMRNLHTEFMARRAEFQNLDAMTIAEGGYTARFFKIPRGDAHAIAEHNHDSELNHREICRCLDPSTPEWQWIYDFAQRRFSSENRRRIPLGRSGK